MNKSPLSRSSILASLSLLSFVAVSAPAFADADMGEDQTITINVGETRVIGNTSVTCQATNLSDRVCFIKKNPHGFKWNPTYDYEVVTSWQAREKFPSGDGIVTRESSAGVFDTVQQAQARMNQLIQKGYCN